MPAWVRRCGWAAVAAALPTVVWRVVVGFGATLGTPASWRRSESIPGSGTGYVIFLSVLQLIAAALTVVLFVPGADRVPRWTPALGGRRFPRVLVVGAAGAVVLVVLCVLSALNWSKSTRSATPRPSRGGRRCAGPVTPRLCSGRCS